MITETKNYCVSGLKRLINKYIWRMDVTKPEISLTPEALVFLYNSKTEYTTIKWTEIKDIQFIQDDFGAGIVPIVEDPQKYIDACTSKVIKFGMNSAMKDYGSPFTLRVGYLDAEPDDIADAIEAYHKENGKPAASEE